jgi:hypothetical protein
MRSTFATELALQVSRIVVLDSSETCMATGTFVHSQLTENLKLTIIRYKSHLSAHGFCCYLNGSEH